MDGRRRRGDRPHADPTDLGRPARPAQTFSLAFGLCVLLRWTLPHSSTRWQTLCGGTASLHCGQMFRAGATRKSWLLRIPLADFDLRLFGTATNALSSTRSEASMSREKYHYPFPWLSFKVDREKSTHEPRAREAFGL